MKPKLLSSQQQRVFDVLQDWADAKAIEAAIRGKTPIKVIISQLRAKLRSHRLTVECDGFYKHTGKKLWRIAPIEKRHIFGREKREQARAAP